MWYISQWFIVSLEILPSIDNYSNYYKVEFFTPDLEFMKNDTVVEKKTRFVLI